MTRGRGGVRIPPKNDDVIYEQPLSIFRVCTAQQHNIALNVKRKLSHITKATPAMGRNIHDPMILVVSTSKLGPRKFLISIVYFLISIVLLLLWVMDDIVMQKY